MASGFTLLHRQDGARAWVNLDRVRVVIEAGPHAILVFGRNEELWTRESAQEVARLLPLPAYEPDSPRTGQPEIPARNLPARPAPPRTSSYYGPG